MSEISIEQLVNIHNEMLLCGALYKNPDLYLKYGIYIRSEYDMYDEATKFFYDNFELMYKTFTQTVDEFKINSFMSQDTERFKVYVKYGGFSTIKNWIGMCDLDDVENYFNIVKKYSLLREYYKKGNVVEKIINHKKFNVLTAHDISRLVIGNANKISTVILSNEESVVINGKVKNNITDCLKSPDIGLAYPYPMLHEKFRGIRKQNMCCFGMLSNEGKSRFMTKLVAYLACFHKEKVCVLLNEMTEKEFNYCLLTTVINNKEFQELHGIEVFKNERDITLGLYIDKKGNYIKRKIDENGEYEETEQEFIDRVELNSEEYNNVLKVSQWLENQSSIFVKELVTYDDTTLEFEIRKHNTIHGITKFFYDTLKNDNGSIGDWAALKITTTALKELANQLNVYIYGSIQLTDDTVYTDIFSLSSMQIASCKNLKHLLDNLCLMKRLDKDEYYKYKYIPSIVWGDKPQPLKLDSEKTYYGCVIDKNRSGEKGVLLFEVDLNKNTWYECGRLVSSGEKKK